MSLITAPDQIKRVDDSLAPFGTRMSARMKLARICRVTFVQVIGHSRLAMAVDLPKHEGDLAKP